MDSAPFIEFCNHVEAVSNVLKTKLKEVNGWSNDDKDWMSPLKYQHETLMGIAVKVKSPNVRNAIINCPYNIRCVIKLSCLYVTPQRRGMSLDLIEAFPCV